MSDIFSFYLQDDVNVYRSSPPLPGIYCPSYLVPSAHAQPLPNFEDSSEIEGFSSDDETDNAEAKEVAGGDNGEEDSPSPNMSAQADQSKGTRTVARKRRSSAQSTSNRSMASFL